MKISINDKIIETNTAYLADLLNELDYGSDWLATAVNAELVTADQRQSYRLKDGDHIEILSPMQGG